MNLFLACLVAAAPLSLEQALARTRQSAIVSSGFAAADDKRHMNSDISWLADGLQVSVQPGWRFFPTTERQVQMGGSITQPFRLSGFAQHRKDEAFAHADALAASAKLVSFTRDEATTRAWFHLWEGHRQFEEARDAHAQAEQLENLVARAAALGALTAADESEAQSFKSEAALQLLSAEGDVWDRSAVLAQAMGVPLQEPLHTTDDLPAAAQSTLAMDQNVMSLLSCHPEVQQDLAQARAARSREREEASYRSNRIDVGVAAYYDNPRGFVTFLNLGVDLGWFDRGERERGSHLAEARLAEGRAKDAESSLGSTLRLLIHEQQHREEVWQEVKSKLVPSLHTLDAQNEKRLAAGDITVFERLQSKRRLLSARVRLRASEAQLGLARESLAHLLRLLGDCRSGAMQ